MSDTPMTLAEQVEALCPCQDGLLIDAKCRHDSGYMCDCRWNIAFKQKRRPMERDKQLYICYSPCHALAEKVRELEEKA